MALQVDSKPLLKLFASGTSSKSESWLAMGKMCRILALRVVHISLVLWAMYSQSLFSLRTDGKARQGKALLATAPCMRYWGDSLHGVDPGMMNFKRFEFFGLWIPML